MRAADSARSRQWKRKSLQREAEAHQNVRLIVTRASLKHGQHSAPKRYTATLPSTATPRVTIPQAPGPCAVARAQPEAQADRCDALWYFHAVRVFVKRYAELAPLGRKMLMLRAQERLCVQLGRLFFREVFV